MDLRIIIQDENRTVLQSLEIYEDGSDSEAVEKITQLIKDRFSSTKEIALEMKKRRKSPVIVRVPLEKQ